LDGEQNQKVRNNKPILRGFQLIAKNTEGIAFAAKSFANRMILWCVAVPLIESFKTKIWEIAGKSPKRSAIDQYERNRKP